MKKVAVTLALALGACASAEPGARRDANLLTRVEIERASHYNALELIRAERPHWLVRRGTKSLVTRSDIVIYLDGTRLGGPDQLRGIPCATIEEVRYYPEREAQYRWGLGHMHGAIEVLSRRG